MPSSRHPRLQPVTIQPFDDVSLLTTGDGSTFRVETQPDRLADLLAAFDGDTPLDQALSGAVDAPAGFGEVIEVLTEVGALAVGAASPTPVLLVGDRELVERVAQLLAGVDGIEVAATIGEPGIQAIEPLTAVLPTAPPNSGPDDGPESDRPVVVVLGRWFDLALLEAVDGLLEATATRWTQLHLVPEGAVWGPHIEPGRTASYLDVVARRRCAVDETGMWEAMASPPVHLGPSSLPDPARLGWLLGSFVQDLTRWLAGRPCRALSTEVTAEATTLDLTDHPVLPLPHRRLTGPLRISGAGSDLLVSERTGIIQRIRTISHDPSVPSRLHTVQTHNSSMYRMDQEWANDVITGGSAFDDAAVARASAIGEAVERYCCNHLGQNRTCWSSYRDLVAAGEDAIDPERLVLYSDATYDAPGCPFVRFDHDLRVRWVQGRSLTRDRPVWLPVSLVFVNWLATEGETHPLTNYMSFSGVAAGRTLDQALVSGIEELIERDATMIWWMNGQPLPAMAPHPVLDALHDRAEQDAWLVPIDNEFDVPVMAGIVEHRDDGWFTIGFAARPDPVDAARKAWTEAYTLQEGSRDLAGPDSLIRQAITWGFASYVDLKPWRADRAYLDDYRPDFRDVSDLMCQQQIFLDRRAVDAVRPVTHTPRTRSWDSLPSLPDRTLTTYRSRVEDRGFEICYVDCTTPDVAVAGYHACRVIIPGLVGNAPAAFPLLGRRRVQDQAVTLGWRTGALPEERLNYWPIPHA